MKKLLLYIITILIIPHIIFADQYWQRYADALSKEQIQCKAQAWIAPFVLEYLTNRISMAQELSRSFDSMKKQNKESQSHISHLSKQVLSLCFVKNVIDSTKKQVTNELQNDNLLSYNDAVIIHTELVLSSFFKHLDTMIDASQSTPQYDTKQIVTQCQPPFDDLSASIRFQELSAKAHYERQQSEYITSIISLCNPSKYAETPIRKNPKLILQLLSQLEEQALSVPECTAFYQKTDGIVYQISIPKKMECVKAIEQIQNKREAIVTEQKSFLLQDIEVIALSHITPIQNQIAQQQQLLAIMKSTEGMAVENEEAFTNYIHHFEKQSHILLDYAKATTLYCQLMLLKEPEINFSDRYQHIIHITTQIQKLLQSLGDSSKEVIPDCLQIFEVLKAFAYVDDTKKCAAELATTMQTLHAIKEDIRQMYSTKKEDTLNPTACNLEVALNIETLEKGIELFNAQLYAQQALDRYACTLQQALESAQTGFTTDTLHHIMAMESVIPVVENFDVQQIVNEYTGQQYLLRKLRTDSTSLVQRIEAYKKKGITVTHYEKAKELAETINRLQPLYTVNVAKYKMNQNNIIIIDKQCAALIKRMLKNNKGAGKI